MKQLLPCGGSHVYSALLALVVLQPYRVTNVEESGSDTTCRHFDILVSNTVSVGERFSGVSRIFNKL